MDVSNVIAGRRVVGIEQFNTVVQGAFPTIRIKSPTLAHLKYLRDWKGTYYGNNYWFDSYKELEVIDLMPLLTAKMLCWYGYDINGTTAAVRGVLVDDLITTTTDKDEIDMWIRMNIPLHPTRSRMVRFN